MSANKTKLLAEAGALRGDEAALHAPIAVICGEAIDVARFVEHYWEPATNEEPGSVTRAGLSFAGPKLKDGVSEEILILERMVSEAHRDYLLAAQPTVASPMGRAEVVLRELKQVLRWHFDDGAVDRRDAQLARVASLHDEVQTQHAMAAALEAYASLAETVRVELDTDLHFDVTLIDEAPQLARQLRERSAERMAPDPAEAALERRNRLAALLQRRVSLVRAAARFVFRELPAILRQVTSAYQRRRRAARRRARRDQAATTSNNVAES